MTFPGVIIHEVAHRIFCDLYDVPVYAIEYFNPTHRSSGRVFYKPISNFKQAFFIGIAPLIVNSLICMLFTFPYAMKLYLGTEFTSKLNLLEYFVRWIGYSAGFNAIPSNQDVYVLMNLTESNFCKLLTIILIKIG